MTTTPNNNYNPHDHLIEIRDKQGGMKKYYPASWRLYELRLKHPTITIESEIIHMDVERNFVIIKASIFDGKTYEESGMRATSMKQGLLSALDKVETAAKARASRDFGISTELALDSEPEEDMDASARAGNRKVALRSEASPVPEARQSLAVQKMLATAKNRVASLGKEWDAIKAEAKLPEVADETLTVQQIATINGVITTHEKKAS